MNRLQLTSIAAALCLTGSAALAQSAGDNSFSSSATQTDGQLKGVLGVGWTGGGDTIVNVQYVNTNVSSDIRAGSGAQLSGGLEYRFNHDFALQGTIGYQMDDATGNPGEVKFIRFPIELVGYYYLTDNWRVGIGGRVTERGRLVSYNTVNSVNLDIDFNRSTGAEFQLEYFFTPHFAIKGIVVKQDYTMQQYPLSFIGNGAGVFLTGYFF